MSVVNISCYKFVTLNDREALKADLGARCQALGLLGTILLAPEGINVFLAGSRAAIDAIALRLTPEAVPALLTLTRVVVGLPPRSRT